MLVEDCKAGLMSDHIHNCTTCQVLLSVFGPQTDGLSEDEGSSIAVEESLLAVLHRNARLLAASQKSSKVHAL